MLKPSVLRSSVASLGNTAETPALLAFVDRLTSKLI